MDELAPEHILPPDLLVQRCFTLQRQDPERVWGTESLLSLQSELHQPIDGEL